MRGQFVVRIRVLSAFFILVAVLLLVRLYFVQVVYGERYSADAEKQYVAETPDTERRGSIYFTSKDDELVSAAIMQSGWRIAIVPKDIPDPTSLYEELSTLTPVDEERFFTSAAKATDPYEEVAFRISDDTAERIRDQKFPGVLLVADQWRFYPAHTLAASTLGFVGYRGDIKVGVYGLERSWQDTLSAFSSGLYVNPFAEIFTNAKAVFSTDPTSEKGSVVTSIEPTVQTKLEEVLDGVVDTYTPKVVGAIVMDPVSGEIVAMATRPTFDPNTYNTVEDPAAFTNPLVEGRYELGSIMKPLTMAAGIDSGAITSATTYYDAGCIERSGKTICNHDQKARHTVPMQEVLSQSLNLGATFVAEEMGSETLTRYFKAYGLDRKTFIHLPNEVTGDLSALRDGHGYDVDYASASFGQGIAVTPIAMTRALAILAGDGVIPNPHVVAAIKYDNGISRAVEYPASARILATSTVEEVTSMLVKVFDEALLDGTLKHEHYSIAAKTGTAQIANPEGGGYYTDRYLHSFFGYFPAHAPRFIIFLFAVEPHGVQYASASLARPFDTMVQFLINYYDIPPDR